MRASPRAWLAWNCCVRHVEFDNFKVQPIGPGHARQETARAARTADAEHLLVAGLGSKIAERTDRFRYSQPMAHGGVDSRTISCAISCLVFRC